MIEKVEALGAEFEMGSIRYMKAAPRGEIDLRSAESADEVSWRIPRAACGQLKCRCIDRPPTRILGVVKIDRLAADQVHVAVVMTSRCWIGEEVSSERDGKARSCNEPAIETPIRQQHPLAFPFVVAWRIPADSALNIVPNIEV